MATPHIESKNEEIAKVVLMPGDPKRAKYIAENYLMDVQVVNQVRGMIAYTGYYKNRKITIFPSGMGNPSMGIYSYELYKEYGVENIIRIGSCGGYSEKLKLNVVVDIIENFYELPFYFVFTSFLFTLQMLHFDIFNHFCFL